jgi:hypothetical protein
MPSDSTAPLRVTLSSLHSFGYDAVGDLASFSETGRIHEDPEAKFSQGHTARGILGPPLNARILKEAHNVTRCRIQVISQIRRPGVLSQS